MKKLLCICIFLATAILSFSREHICITQIYNTKDKEYQNWEKSEYIYEGKEISIENYFIWDRYENRWQHTKTFYYDYEGGRLKSKTQKDFYATDNQWRWGMRYRYEYCGDTIIEYEDRYNNIEATKEDWSSFSRSELTYNDNFLAKKFTERWDKTTKSFYPFQNTEYEYDNRWECIKECVSEFHDEHWDEAFHQEFSYNKKSQRISSVFIDSTHKKINIRHFRYFYE